MGMTREEALAVYRKAFSQQRRWVDDAPLVAKARDEGLLAVAAEAERRGREAALKEAASKVADFSASVAEGLMALCQHATALALGNLAHEIERSTTTPEPAR